MESDAQTPTFAVRFPNNLHQAVRDSAARQGISLNELLREIAETHLRQEEERRLFDSFTRLGENFEEGDATFFQQVELRLDAAVNPPTLRGKD